MSHMNEDEEQFSDGGVDEFEQLHFEQITCTEPSQAIQTANRNLHRKEEVKLKMLKADPILQQEKINKSNRQLLKRGRVIKVGSALFRSDFESGNIENVSMVSSNTYEITLQKETYSERTSTWFYFRCQGLKGQVKFVIKGFTKASSLYNEGMKICYQEKEKSWKRGGFKICYIQSDEDENQGKKTYELHFNFFFRSEEFVELAYCFPYTYTHLLSFLQSFQEKMKIQALGKTYEGRNIPLLTIGNENSPKVVIISARVHPGQTVGSHMMEGFLKKLLGNSEHATSLREAFLFKIVPMVNPDGVIQGNYRFSGSGFDLNRKWRGCSEKLHPEIYAFRQFIRKIKKKKEVLIFIDLHGHSRQKNVFFYGCCPKGKLDQDGNLYSKPKQFPFFMSSLHCPFRYDYCCYKVQKDKEGTARVTLWKELNIDYVYTLQSTFCSSSGGSNYNISDYHQIGAKLCEGICLYFWKQAAAILSKEGSPIYKKMEEEKKAKMREFFENPELANVEFSQNDSDSEPEAGEIPEEHRHHQHQLTGKGIQKYYKGLKRLKLLAKGQSKNVIQKKEKKSHGKTNSVKIQIRTQGGPRFRVKEESNKNILETHLQKVDGGIKKEKKYIHHSYFQPQLANKTIHSHFYKEDQRKRDNIFSFVPEEVVSKYKSEELKQSKLRKKGLSFEGAQYRRVRKMAEQHNRKHILLTQRNFSQCDSDQTLIKGLVGMNDLIQMDKPTTVKQTSNSFFPLNSFQNRKVRKGSIEMHFRHQIKASDYNSKRIHLNQFDVKCEGRQIM